MKDLIEMTYAQMLDRIDTSDYTELQKVERYKQLMIMNKRIDEEIENDGIKIIVENGSQTFLKAHPLLADKIKLNTAMQNLEKAINFKKVNTSVELEPKRAAKAKLKLV